MVNVSTNDSKITINVTSAGTKGSVQAVNDLAHYYEQLAKEHAEQAHLSEDNAHIWAEGTDGQVNPLGGEHSSKGWAEETQTRAEQGVQNIENAEQEAITSLTEATSDHVVELQELQDTIKDGLDTVRTNCINDITNAKDESIDAVTTAKTNAISAVETEGNTQKQAVINVSNEEQDKLQGYVNQAQTSATNAHTSELACLDVLNKIGTAIKIKGRVNTFEDLPKTGNLDGDAYLVGEEGLSSYPEYYWYQNHWEFLGTSGGGGTWGTLTGDINAQTDLINKFSEKQDSLTSGANIDITNNVISVTGDLGCQVIIRSW